MRISDWSSDVCSSDLAGEEDGEDGSGAGRAEVDGAESCGEYGDLVAHLVHVGAGGVDDADAELVGDLERGCEQGERDEGSEDRLGQPEGGSGECGWFAADTAAADLEQDRKSVGEGKSVAARVNFGGGRIITKKKRTTKNK